MTEAERQELLEKSREQLEFARFCIGFAKQNIFYKLDPETIGLGQITTGFLGTVKPEDGSLSLFDGVLRLMKPDGSFQDFTTSNTSISWASTSRTGPIPRCLSPGPGMRASP